ncbi:hypothetical protein JOC70_001315 [Clostridium pascui]|uniref:hypothetical protein n=1 Tax=Clostridium pascui TaxID=46609 RepID=UPI00195957D7|nr:hypothetical protein [Clostridium pascui]MBM7869845.1 hypothetical protein [Clostridium pascui]
MKIKIKKKNIAVLCILEFILFFGFFSRYIEYSGIWNSMLAIGTIVVLGTEKKCRKSFIRNRRFMICLLCTILLIGMGIIFANSNEFLKDNLLTMLYPFLICAIIFSVAYAKSEAVSNFFDMNFYLVNAIWLINLFVLSRQITGSGFMIKSSWLALNGFYADQSCGLFGNSGTHELGLFSIFVLLYNFYYVDFKVESSIKRKACLFYTIITEGMMLYFSTYNENMTLFLLMPIFAIMYILLKIDWTSHNVVKRVSKLGKYFLLMLVMVAIILSVPQQRNYIYEELSARVMKILTFDVSVINGSNERLAIPYYGLTNEWGWKFGKGIGAWRLHKGGYLGFNHFGLSSVGSFINLGGIWFYLLYCFLNAIMLQEICNRGRKSGMFLIVTLCSVILLSIYTVIFTSSVSIIWLALSFAILGEMKKGIDGKEDFNG